jgi:excisionase family DNA binding protein
MPESVRPPTFTVTFPPDELEALAECVADLLEQARGDGFLDADGAAAYLGLTRKAVYALVERRRLPYYRPAGRLLFDRHELRAWVTGDRIRRVAKSAVSRQAETDKRMPRRRANAPGPDTRRNP